MDRYVGMTREECFDADGFFHTGDVGYVDADGDVHWTGRRTEMIKTAGANVSPAELEIALRACPAVRRARVVGLPDERLGEIVTLCVEPADGADADEDELKAFLRRAGGRVQGAPHRPVLRRRRDARRPGATPRSATTSSSPWPSAG